MEISINELNDNKIDVSCILNKEDIDKKRDEVLNIFKNAQVPGFRKNKASLEVIKIHYRKQIDEALSRALAEEAYHNTLFEKEIKPFGLPEFKSFNLEGNKFTCEFSMFKKPEFTLANYKGLEIPKQDTGFNSTELMQEFLQQTRRRFGESNPFTPEDIIQDTDDVIIDYKAFLTNDDGSEIELANLSAEGELLTIGKSKLIGFDDHLIGMKIGEKKSFVLQIPDTGLPSVAGKMVKFEVSFQMGNKITPAPLNDDLAVKVKKTGENIAQLMQSETILELERAVSEIASVNVENQKRLAQVNQLSARLIDDNEFDVPHWLTLSEAQYLAQNSKLDWETLSDEDKVKFLSMSENNVRLSLILDKVRDEEPEAQLSDQEVVEMVKSAVSKTNPDNTEEVLTQMSQSGYLNVLVARLRDEHTIDWILKQSKIIE